MKYSLFKLSIVFFLSLLASCTKHNQEIIPDPSGRWEASKDIGGEYQGSIFIPGNGNIFEFEASSFKRFQTGTLIESGFYKLIKEPFENFSYRLILNNDYNTRYFLNVDNNNLIIATDGIIKTVRLYTRIP